MSTATISAKNLDFPTQFVEAMRVIKSRTPFESTAFKVFRLVVLILATAAGAALGAHIGGPLGAALGGGIAFAVALEAIDKLQEYLENRALNRYLANHQLHPEEQQTA